MLHDDLQAEALSLGFSLLGVTTLEPTPHADVFQRWLEHGYQAGMAYMSQPGALEKRLNPQRIFPAGRSVISVAAPYPTPETSKAEGIGHGRVAAYAWGTDYHLVLTELLNTLAHKLAYISNQPIEFRAFTDSAPLPERDLAQRAGLGWIGKNSCLIHPRLGSFFFLAELVVSLELEPDEPFSAERCGSCQRCIQACPTGCINPDRTIDARRCISYLTIENKGSIPAELRPLLRDWIFGCDLCQIACPWNHRARQTIPLSTFSSHGENNSPDLIKTLSLSPLQFNSIYRNSPILRAKRRGFLRNAAVVLGNQGDPSFLNTLAHVLTSEPEPLIRAHAAWAIHQIRSPQVALILNRARSSETHPQVLQELSG